MHGRNEKAAGRAGNRASATRGGHPDAREVSDTQWKHSNIHPIEFLCINVNIITGRKSQCRSSLVKAQEIGPE